MTEEEPELASEDPIGVGIDRSAVADTVQQAFDPKPIAWGPGADGLPVPEMRGNLPLAPALHPRTFVCMADESEFVIRRQPWGEVVARFRPNEISRGANGDPFVTVSEAILAGARFIDILRAADLRTRRVRVEPLRPQCKYLAQQMVDFADRTDKVLLERLCTARRDSESFFVGLRDTQVHACELRYPHDPVSDERIRIMNETKVKLGEERTRELNDSWDLDQALRDDRERAMNEGVEHTNIFGSNQGK